MARDRAKLTDKQERILVQCQLMGLTTADMVKISNRLRALDAEREYREEIADIVASHKVEAIPKGWRIISDTGIVYSCTKKRARSNSDWYNRGPNWVWDIDIFPKKGSKKPPRTVANHKVWINDTLTTRSCPEGDKQLFGLFRSIKNKKI